MRVLFLSAFLCSFLFAHKLNLFLFEENNKVIASSYFASGAFCKECRVEVFDSKDKLVETGYTDAKGEYIIKNISSKLFVKVEAIGGHGARLEYELENLGTKNETLEISNSSWQSLIAIFLIFLILLALKRVKK